MFRIAVMATATASAIVREAERLRDEAPRPMPVDENWMRVAPGTDAAIWRPWSRETGEL